MVLDTPEMLRHHQRRQRREIAIFEEVEERVAVVRIADLMRRRLGAAAAEEAERAGRRGAGAGQGERPCSGDRETESRHEANVGKWPHRGSLPELDVELGLQLSGRILDTQLDVLGFGRLLELDRRAALVVALVRALAGEERRQLMLSGLQVAEVDALDTAAVQGLDLERRVKVVGDDLVVELHLDRIELEQLAHVHRDEEGHLRVRREEQFLLEYEKVAIELDDVAFHRSEE